MLLPSLIACANDEQSEKVLGTVVSLITEVISNVRVGIIGMVNRGSVLIQMFDYLIKNNHAEIVALSDVSMSSREQSLSTAEKTNFKAHEFACGDINTTLIKN